MLDKSLTKKDDKKDVSAFLAEKTTFIFKENAAVLDEPMSIDNGVVVAAFSSKKTAITVQVEENCVRTSVTADITQVNYAAVVIVDINDGDVQVADLFQIDS